MDLILIIALILSLGIIAFLIFMLLRKRGGTEEAMVITEQHLNLRMKAYEESTSRLLEETRRQYERQIELLQQRLDRQAEDMQKRSALHFSTLANDVLERQTERLSRENLHDIDTILSPLRENLSDFRKAVMESYVNENASREALASKIDMLAKANSEISRETRNLSNALRGNASAQGRWGETVLEQLLESSGLVRGVHFLTQTSKLDGKSLHDEDGAGQRPDVILLLPGEHKVIIDSKTSLSDYLRSLEAPDEQQAGLFLKSHAQSARKHVDELGKKQYHKNVQGALEHTLMFMPNDAAYLAALRGDSSLCDYAMKKNVVIVSPAHLLSVVQIVAQIWRVENQNRNAEKIAEIGGKLYDKIHAFLTDFEAIDTHLRRASNSYTKSLETLTKGRTSVVSHAESLRTMGARTTRRIPSHLLDTPEPADQNDAE